MERYRGTWDKFSITVSMVCLLHCLALPVIVAGATLAGFYSGFEIWVDTLLLATAFAAGCFAMWRGFQVHGKYLAAAMFAAGITLLIAGSFFHHTGTGVLLKIAGAMVLIFAHLKNYRLSGCRTNNLVFEKK